MSCVVSFPTYLFRPIHRLGAPIPFKQAGAIQQLVEQRHYLSATLSVFVEPSPIIPNREAARRTQHRDGPFPISAALNAPNGSFAARWCVLAKCTCPTQAKSRHAQRASLRPRRVNLNRSNPAWRPAQSPPRSTLTCHQYRV
jgi:hypothetical protein